MFSFAENINPTIGYMLIAVLYDAVLKIDDFSISNNRELGDFFPLKRIVMILGMHFPIAL
ncbi:hypothetical protein D3C71_1882180 [compost metagenome]